MELSMKKTSKEVKLRHKVLTRLIEPFVRIYIVIKYKLSFKKYKTLNKKGPFIVLANHTVNIDPMIMGMQFPFHLYYIATEQVFNLGFLSKVIKFIVNPIKKSKSVSDMETIRKTKRIVQQGGSIGIFPEGNTSYSGQTVQIMPATVKLIKMLKIPVIIMNIKGMYLSYPRWAIYKKKGKTEAFIRKIILPDTYLEMSDEDLFFEIEDNLFVDAYADQEASGNLYKGKHIAHGLEKLIFIDLMSKKPFVTYSKGNKLKSHDSDFELTYLPNGKVLDKDNQLHTLVEIERQVKIAYFNYYKENKESLLFEEEVQLVKSFATHKEKLGRYRLKLFKERVYLTNVDNTLDFSFDEITNIVMQGKYQVIIYLPNETYMMRLDDYSSIYKYVLTYQYYMYIKDGGTSIDDKHFNFGI